MPKITEMFAFICEDNGPEDEGIMGFRDNTGQWFPMVGADIERIISLTPIADEISRNSGKPYRILKFKLVGVIGKNPLH